jgi:acetyl esterase/lipase
MSGSTLISKDDVDPLIHKGYLDELAHAYLAGGMDRKDPRVSPLFPPTLIQVGSAETLLADATRLAGALGSADVPVTLEVWPHISVLGNCGMRISSPRARRCRRVPAQPRMRGPARPGPFPHFIAYRPP